MLRLSSYLAANRLGVFYFRLVIPNALRLACPALPREIRRSLKTREPNLAKAASRIIGANFNELIQHLYLMKDTGVPPSKWLVGYAEDGKLSIKKEAGDNASELAEIIAAFVQAGKMTGEAAADPIARMAFNPSPEEIREVKQINRGRRGEWLSDAIERFREEKQVSDWKDSNTWNSAYEPTLRHFRELISEGTRVAKIDGKSVTIDDIRVSDILDTHIRQFKSDMLVFPSYVGHLERSGNGAKMTAKEAMGTYKNRTTQSHSTALKKYGYLKAFLRWADDDMCIPDGVRYSRILPSKNNKLSRNQRESGYAAFTGKDLKTLFESPEYSSGFEHSWQYWIPMIGLYTGARINEISQLNVSDIVVQDSIRCFSINDLPDEDETDGEFAEGDPQKTVKSSASVRFIPIHPELIKAGLDDYIAEVKTNAGKRLFETLGWSKKSHYGAVPSKFFREYTKNHGVYVERKKVFHSFRRTLNQALQKAGMHQEHRERLLGHSNTSVNDTHYGGETPLHVINKFLCGYSHGLTHPVYSRPVSLAGIF